MFKTSRLISGLLSISFETNTKSKHPKTVNKLEMQKNIVWTWSHRDIRHYCFIVNVSPICVWFDGKQQIFKIKRTVEMEYAILDICSLECVFKWSVSRPISGSSESILARYVSQVVSKHTKLGSRGAECCKRAETYWPEGLDAKWSVIWKCLLKILLLPPSTLPFQQRKKRENVLSYFLVWTQYSSYCHGIFNAHLYVGICTHTHKRN